MADLRVRIEALVAEAGESPRGYVWDAIADARDAWCRGNPSEVEATIAELKWQVHQEREWEAKKLSTAAHRGASR
jgi:hypothetical protein